MNGRIIDARAIPDQSFCAFKCIMPEMRPPCRTQRRVRTFKDSPMLIKINELSEKSRASSCAVINSLFHLAIDSSPELYAARTSWKFLSLSSSSSDASSQGEALITKRVFSRSSSSQPPCISTRFLAYVFLTPMLLFARRCSSRVTSRVTSL